MDFNEFELPKKIDEKAEKEEIVEEKKELPNMIDEAKESINKEIHSMKDFFRDIFKYLTTRNSKELLELLWRLALIAVFILLLFVPFQLVRDLLSDFLVSMGVEFSERMLAIYVSAFNAIYTIIALVLFFILCKERFYKFVNEEKKTTLK